MANADKVLQALPLSRMVKRVDDVRFSTLVKGGFYITLLENIVMEFDTLQDANRVATDLNIALSSVLTTFKNDYNLKIGAILA